VKCGIYVVGYEVLLIAEAAKREAEAGQGDKVGLPRPRLRMTRGYQKYFHFTVRVKEA
jgi:hypothetical protein